MYGMRKYHRLEFNQHISQMIRSFIFTELSLILFIGQQVYTYYSFLCLPSKLTGDIRNPLTDEYYAMNDWTVAEGQGICYYALAFFRFGIRSDFDIFNSTCFYFNMSILIPILTFFAFDKPHDCFSCLAKDPGRKYSILQLTLEEGIKRNMVAKFSKAK